MIIPVCHSVRVGMGRNHRAAYLEWLVAHGERLVPPATRSKPWPVPAKFRGLPTGGPPKGRPAPPDGSGDDEFVFFTPGKPEDLGSPVAFGLESLFEEGDVGWRGRDIGHAYAEARKARVSPRAVADALTCFRAAVVRKAAGFQATALLAPTAVARISAERNLSRLWHNEVWGSAAVRSLRDKIARGGGELDDALLRPDLDRSDLESPEPPPTVRGGSQVVLRGSVGLDLCVGWYDERDARWRKPEEAVG